MQVFHAKFTSSDHLQVLVATGSVASVKVPELAVKLADFAEAQLVAVILTSAAEVMTSAKIAGRSLEKPRLRYQDVSSDLVVHVELRKWADVALVAPCSANTLGKMALGLCAAGPSAGEGWVIPMVLPWLEQH
eukprot:Skav210484  [mRNA]  locus=scaffold737:791292:793615:- [translate_table: standard]